MCIKRISADIWLYKLAVYQTVRSIDRHHSLDTPWCNSEYKLSGTHVLVLQMVCRLVGLTIKKAQRTNTRFEQGYQYCYGWMPNRDLPRVSAYLISEYITPTMRNMLYFFLGGTILRTYWVSKQPNYGEPVPCDRKIFSRRHKIIDYIMTEG